METLFAIGACAVIVFAGGRRIWLTWRPSPCPYNDPHCSPEGPCRLCVGDTGW